MTDPLKQQTAVPQDLANQALNELLPRACEQHTQIAAEVLRALIDLGIATDNHGDCVITYYTDGQHAGSTYVGGGGDDDDTVTVWLGATTVSMTFRARK